VRCKHMAQHRRQINAWASPRREHDRPKIIRYWHAGAPRAALCMSREEFYLRQILFRMDGRSLARHVLTIGRTERLICLKCGAKLIATPSPSANGLRALHCPDCDCLDPLKSGRAMGWLKSELQPPKR
jgi:hypothetical protein